MAKEEASGGGGRALLLLALLALLAGGVAWNYQRNLALEKAEVRPYGTLSDADLATLLTATEAEAAALDAAYQRAKGAPAKAAPASDRFAAFESAQARGRAARDLGYRASGTEAVAAALREEQSHRAAQGDERAIFLRRAFTF